MSPRGHSRTDASDSARRLVEDLAEARGLEGVAEELEAIERAGEAAVPTGEVVSAIELDAAQRAALEERLRSRFGEGLQVVYRVQPLILGGLIVRVGDHYLDGSVAARLGQLRKTLVGTR